jgi:hypothetical protein
VYGKLEEPGAKPSMILDTMHRWEGKVLVDKTVQTLWRTHRGPAVYRTLPSACHGDFGGLARLGRTYNARHPEAPVDIDGELLCAPDPVALERDVRQRVLAFFATYLRSGGTARSTKKNAREPLAAGKFQLFGERLEETVQL